MRKIEPWDSPLTDSKAINKDLLKFHFEQAEKHLKTSIDIADRITTRCYTLLATVIPALSVIIGTIAKSILSNERLPNGILIGLFILLVPLFACLYSLLWAAFPKMYTRLGSEPRNKVDPMYYDNPEYTGEESYKLMLTYELEEYQGRIDYADCQNTERIKKLKLALYIIVLTLPMVTVGLIALVI